MFFAILMGLTRLMAPEGEGAPAGGAPPPQPSGSPPAAPFAVFPDQASFDERVNRAARSLLHKELGTKDTTETKARLARLEELERAEEARKQAELTAEERRTKELAAEKARADRLEEQLNETRTQRLVASECAARGIKGIDYAEFLIAEKTSSLPEGEQLDVGAFLDEQLKDERRKVALGIAAPPVTPVPAPATTVPIPEAPSPPPPAPGATGPAKTAFDLDPVAWQKRKSELGVS